jgi:hypothetical protein
MKAKDEMEKWRVFILSGTKLGWGSSIRPIVGPSGARVKFQMMEGKGEITLIEWIDLTSLTLPTQARYLR